MSRTVKGAPTILAAIFVAGVLGYFATVLVFREIGSADYVWFAAYWSALYLVIGSLSGIEQEFSRATKSATPETSQAKSPALIFAAVLAAALFAIAFLTSSIWAESLLGDEGHNFVLPFAIGVAGFVFVATLGGILYGLSQWNLLALMIGVDGLIRVSLLLIALQLTDDLLVLAWCVSIAFPLTIALLWPAIRRAIHRQAVVDVDMAKLTWNVARTLVASASAALLVTGFPLVIVFASEGRDLAFVGQLILCLTLLRAPLIVVAMSMQSFLVVKFRDQKHSSAIIMLVINGGIVLLTLAMTWLSPNWGPVLFAIVSEEEILITGELFALISISAGLFAMMIVSSTPVLARGYHFVYSLGWVLSAATTVLLVLGQGEFVDRVISAILLGPLVGLGIFLTALLVKRKKSAPSELLGART